MKILLAITKSNFGGAQRYVRDLAISFHERGDDVLVVVGGNGVLTEKLREGNIRVEILPTLGRDISFKDDLKAMRDFARIINREKPDILHINSSKIGGLGALLGRILLVPGVIFTAHGWAFNESRPWWQRLIIRVASIATVLLAHKTILVSKETGRQLGFKSLLRHKTILIHNGRAVPQFLSREEARKAIAVRVPSLAMYANDIWTMSIGELHPVKRHDLMIEAMETLVRTHPHLRHIIVGEGELRESLQNEIIARKLVDNVFLIGQLPEASRYLKAADFFVLPSRSEALPYVLIEATQAGLPIIASDVGGIHEVIENNKSGILIHPGRADEFAHAITHLLESPTEVKRITEAALERSQYFTLERMAAETYNLYLSRIKK